jgi:glycosyltransferase involved in cell wall biosynthesis
VDRVTFLGAVDTRRRDELLGRASVVVVPSRILPNGRSEGTPLIALEALAAGVPVVASAVGGLREVRSLSLVRPDDPRQLAAAIEGVLAHPPSPAALRGSVADLGWPDVAARLLAATA